MPSHRGYGRPSASRVAAERAARAPRPAEQRGPRVHDGPEVARRAPRRRRSRPTRPPRPRWGRSSGSGSGRREPGGHDQPEEADRHALRAQPQARDRRGAGPAATGAGSPAGTRASRGLPRTKRPMTTKESATAAAAPATQSAERHREVVSLAEAVGRGRPSAGRGQQQRAGSGPSPGRAPTP